ncbi:MAG: flippase, partial [Candidatus Bathyarchaeota archaeon]|nr:flippase [Candidatus Bathyarchaeota archaeon]
EEIVTIAKGAGIVFIGTTIGSGLRYIFQIIIARNLGAELFGAFFLGFAVFKVTGMIAELGLPNGIVRYVAIFHGARDERRVKGIIASVVTAAIFSGIVVASLVILLSKTIAFNLLHKMELTNVLRFFALAIPFTTLTTMLVFSTQGFKIMKYRVFVREIFEPSLRLIMVIILFIFGWKLYGVIFAYLIPGIFGTLLAFYYLKKIFPQITRGEVLPIYETKKLLDFSWPLLLVQFFGLTILWTDTLMLGFFKTFKDVGIYSAAQRTALLGSIIMISFNSIFAPVISDLYNRRELNKLNNLFKTVAKWIFTFSFPIFLLMIFFAKSILNIFGSEFIPGATCLIILSIGWLIHSSTGSVGQMITMTGRPKLNLMNVTGVLISNIILNLLLIPKYGILGAAIATAISLGLINMITILEGSLILKMYPYRIDFFKPLIAGCVSLVALFFYTKHILQNHINFQLFIGVLIFLVLYSITLVLLGVREEDKIVLEKIKTKLFSH